MPANEDMKAKAARQIESQEEKKRNCQVKFATKTKTETCIHAQIMKKTVAVRKTLDVFWPMRNYEEY